MHSCLRCLSLLALGSLLLLILDLSLLSLQGLILYLSLLELSLLDLLLEFLFFLSGVVLQLCSFPFHLAGGCLSELGIG